MTTDKTSVVETLNFGAASAGATVVVVAEFCAGSSLTRGDVADFFSVVHGKGEFRKKKMKTRAIEYKVAARW